MTNDLENLTAEAGLKEADVPVLLAALLSSSRRVERVALSSGAVWIKRYGTERASRWVSLQRMLANLIKAPFLRPSPLLGDEGMAAREMRRVAQFSAQDVPTARVLYSSGAAIVFTDVGDTVDRQLHHVLNNDPVAHDNMLVHCAAELGRLHSKGLCHGRPYPRDMFLKDGRVGFMDFEEEPDRVMPLEVAQARDIWLLFLQVATRAKLGGKTHDRAYKAWADVAPAAAVAELRKLTGFLGGFLSAARLIGRVHMGSDLRRFIVATSYLKQVS
ncbi:serine/threonine protein phosphatase [Rhizobium grahamii]|uniref:Serine/threonine protein phosphatase n=1 Tax=Rhizobium grahamii TaxID=1120045 RepID=A0A5Q0C9T2_9HYPH|nr:MULTISPECIES: serine/threonine protein phosphatase [Rhizobium]QFY62085.1 serine/threonine protein phosphatase [Rhizobium grahamii]QRM48735.1 serine/threonine protein phosphatase [Rhizobium sp. BG6]